MIVIVMGVSGCGKSTIAELLGKRLGLPWYDADRFHPRANIEKMEQGIPLTDLDRAPWLDRLASEIALWEKTGGAVLACSALKQSYRDVLSSRSTGPVSIVHLAGTKELIAERMKQRSGHYMPLSLLDSQFAALEPPQNAIKVSIDGTPEKITDQIVAAMEESRVAR